MQRLLRAPETGETVEVSALSLESERFGEESMPPSRASDFQPRPLPEMRFYDGGRSRSVTCAISTLDS
jgi:hypothetical protein